MERVLRAIVLVAAFSLADSIFGEDTEHPWEDGYSDEPGWTATVEAYRQIEYRKRDVLQKQAGDDALQIAWAMAAGVVVFFATMSQAVWTLTEKEAGALHQYVMEHHQTADEVDKLTGAKAALESKMHDRGRIGLGQTTGAAESEGLDYMERVEGRFGHANHVLEATSAKPETMRGRLAKIKRHNKHVDSMIERAFAAVDTDDSGALSRDELKQVLIHMKQPHSDAALDDVMAKFDPDKSGTVSFAEFRDGWEEYNSQAAKNVGSDNLDEAAAAIVSGAKASAKSAAQADR